MPELFIDGKKSSRMWGRLALPADYAPEKLEQYRGAGIKVYMTAMDVTVPLCRDGEDEYYFDKYDAHIRRLVDRMPDIKLILYVGARGASPYRWCKKNYEELTLFSTGKRLETASHASELWKQDSNRAFREFVRYFSNGKYAGNIIGFNPVYNANEWFSHHRLSNDDLGRLEASNQPSLVVRELENRNSVYSVSPMLPAGILRNIFTEAGVHVYNHSGEAVYANSGFIGISCISGTGGEKEICLPDRCDVFDAMTGDLLAKSVSRFTMEMKFKETRLLKLVFG